ncbi:MAG: hypothetical protein CME65_06260 [Halobacteriovoraceae bacterium]|nr:hypothetical protein [Halobacteriovoraceae bacterium]|tara:strand:- start:11339 stop:11629 length:291 start_codon:yes stop_codon:yes gene_type:complete
MKKLLLSTLLFSTSVVAADSDCFLDYNNVCGKNEQGQFSEYLNECHLEKAGAKEVSYENCQIDQSRNPASASHSVFTDLERVESEIDTILTSESES